MVLMERHVAQELLIHIDALIHNLSDSNVVKRKPETKAKTSRKRRRVSNAAAAEISSNPYTKERSPVGLERQYDELYTMLRRGLLGCSNDERNLDGEQNYESKKNVSALLLGPRGQGKSLVLERVLKSLTNEWQTKMAKQSNNGQDNKTVTSPLVPFRLIRLDGILLRGHDVNIAVKEIVRQLSEIASRESFERLCCYTNPAATNSNSQNTNSTKTFNDGEKAFKSDHSGAIHEKLYNILEKDSYNLRTRKTTFNNSLATLDEALKTACIDSIPILIIMDELDSFLNHSTSINVNSSSNTSSSSVDVTSKRHLLLYHLLDRVAGKGSLISMVSSTSRLSTIGMFEKRVRSRAEGTTKIIYFGRPATYEELVNILLSKIDEYDNGHNKDEVCEMEDNHDDEPMQRFLKEQISAILLPASQHLDKGVDSSTSSDEKQRQEDEMFMVRDILKRNLTFGQDVRWFCRILALTLSLYMEEFHEMIECYDCDDHVNGDMVSIPSIKRDHFVDALIAMGGMDINVKSINLTKNNDAMNHPVDQNMLDYENPRINRLRDLPGPQITILLSAKRILYRDAQNESSNVPLTFERILKEYESYFVAQSRSTGPDHYSQHTLFRSFCDLIGGFLMPARDHSGGGPGQYNFGHHFSNIENSSLSHMPLHVNLDLEGELGESLKRNLLDCTSALRDWGLTGCKSS